FLAFSVGLEMLKKTTIEFAFLNAKNYLKNKKNHEKKADLWKKQLKLERETTARNIASSKVIVK
ncbi:hypothetical protein JT096_06360, partial [Helicobacter pylori]|nr:hypothetical protein [Helicobacter pylori]